MLISLTLNNFRKAVNTSIEFTEGLNVLRGANERGKTTTIEGVSYALYGTSALRTSLEECVTWGEKPATLKAILVYKGPANVFRFERSKGGASVYRDAEQVPFVTGQREVTAFASELLGADAKTAALLMMASQADLRGALDEGPGAVSSLIGKLADFALVDTLLVRAQERLLTGSAAPFTAKLAGFRTDLETLRANAPSADLDGAQADLDAAQAGADALMAARDAASAASDELLLKLANGRSLRQKHSTLQQEHIRASAKLGETVGKLEATRATIADRPSQEALDAAAADVASFGKMAELVQAKGLVDAAAKVFPEVHWEGEEAGFLKELQGLTARRQDMQNEVSNFTMQARAVSARRITSGKCPTCGHAAVGDDHVKATNDALNAEATALLEKAAQAGRLAAGVQSDLDDLVGVQKSAATAIRLRAWLANRALPVSIDEGTYPPRFNWIGPQPSVEGKAQAEQRLANLQALLNAAVRAGGAEATLCGQFVHLEGEVQRITNLRGEVLDALIDYDIPALEGQGQQATAALSQAMQELNAGLGRVKVAEQVLRDRKAALAAHAAQVENLKVRIQEAEADLVKLDFNNALMKKLKALKPAVTDHLWGIVLASVGTFFSQIRGEVSVVTKDSSGFKVNGRDIASLSGSTLDALALAVRVALTRTFIPHTSLLTLDEPAHGADDQRTGNILGFLAGAGFQQTILCSHDPLSESVASNVVVVGE